MDAWYLPNMCIRVFSGQYLSPDERFSLNVATGLSEHLSSVVVRCYRIIRYDEVRRIIRDILLPSRVQSWCYADTAWSRCISGDV